MTNSFSGLSKTITFTESRLSVLTKFFGSLLDIPVFDNRTDLENLDKLTFHLSQHRLVPIQSDPETSEIWRGTNASEIVGSEDFYYANGKFGYTEIVNPFYEVWRNGKSNIFEGKENDVSIRLEFSGVTEARKAILTHEWPGRAPIVREYIQLGRGAYIIPDIYI